ncbi:hypothetical protein NA56DRAFT_647793 [Hyaloscypha hepaticicola]|uniref:Uncharacterized protein n=1 Tax=Hyaloscypha hepaticicola TaxID=2082293 RepID=A0A2J6PX61_9HELO|nr:hypothetical protein NA56DRAFT_647793 [Hyaloscypha hepaticicola]
MVSSDAAISIAFGLIGVCISLIGVWINYLTLRAWNVDTGHVNHSTQSHHKHTYYIVPFPVARNRVSSIA